MTKIEDMSEQERQSWTTLFADVSVFTLFLGKMMSGKTVNNFSAGELVGVYIYVIVATIIIHSVIASIFAARRVKITRGVMGAEDAIAIGMQIGVAENDERDIEIERKGARNGFWVVSILINVIIFTLLVENSVGGDYMGPLSVLEPSHMFLALLSSMFLGDIVYRGTMVLAYRG